MMIKISLATILFLTLLVVVYFYYLSLTSSPPEAQLKKGVLRPCPDKPNCVSSESGLPYSSIPPLRYSSADEQAWHDFIAAVEDGGGTIQKNTEHFLWATYTSKIFRFVDDLEARLDKGEKQIHLRSASRAGHSDLGVNRKRVESLRKRFRQRQENRTD